MTAICTPDFTKGIPWSYDQRTRIWYSFMPYKRGSWNAMDAHCRQTDQGRATMATIKTAHEQSFISTMIKGFKDDDVWIGGGRFDSLETMYWYKVSMELEPFTYSNFISGEPDKSGNCIYIRHSDHRWGDYACSYNNGATICELR